ncbi:MAG TPA: DUF445 family protein [Rhodothermales bacterium]|nr:DUF445 family protein [Rhodothermales bacterium]
MPDSPAKEQAANSNGSQATPPPKETAPGQAQTLPEAREKTLARARDLRALLAIYIRRHLPPTPRAPKVVEAPPKMTGSYARFLIFLQIIPALLVLVFVASFFWDFEGVVVTSFGQRLSLEGLLRILSVSGLIGFGTNWLAIAMLFHPRERRPIFGQGLIPAQRDRVIYQLARAVSEELINEEIIKRKIEESEVIPHYREMAMGITRAVLEDPDFRRDTKRLAAEYVDEVLSSEEVRRRIIDFTIEKVEQHAGQGLGGIALKTYRFLNEADFQRRIDGAIREIPSSLDGAFDGLDQLLDRMPEKIEAHSEEIEQWVTRIVLGFVENLDIYEMVVSNMRQYDELRLEALLKNSANEQLNYIKYLGGVLGVIGGLVIWKPLLSLVIFGALGVLLLVLDRVLYRAPAARPLR